MDVLTTLKQIADYFEHCDNLDPDLNFRKYKEATLSVIDTYEKRQVIPEKLGQFYYCTYCRSPVFAWYKFCPTCGKELKWESIY